LVGVLGDRLGWAGNVAPVTMERRQRRRPRSPVRFAPMCEGTPGHNHTDARVIGPRRRPIIPGGGRSLEVRSMRHHPGIRRWLSEPGELGAARRCTG